jgi:hypothetical protein
MKTIFGLKVHLTYVMLYTSSTLRLGCGRDYPGLRTFGKERVFAVELSGLFKGISDR